MFKFGRCKRKGHKWQYYGWSVMGFGPYRYHYKCPHCGAVTQADEAEEEQEDES